MLEDIAAARAFVAKSTRNVTAADFASNQLLRQAMERNFEIMREALLRLERADSGTAGRISDYRAVIGLRNRLVHGYDTINNARVWDIIQGFLPILHIEVTALLEEAEGELPELEEQ